MLNLIIALLPDEMLPLAIIVTAVAVIVGVVKPRTAFGFIGGLLLMVVLAPFVDALLSVLPWWLVAFFVFAMIWSLLRALLDGFLGPHAAGHVIGVGVVGLIKLVAFLVFLPVRVGFRLLRGDFR